MAVTVFSSTGCARCAIVKQYLHENNIDFTEHNIKTEVGNEAFKEFYKANRNCVKRDKSGIFFPVVKDDTTIVQDAGVSLNWFMTQGKLNQSIQESNLGHGWIGGLNISLVPENYFTSFFQILTRLQAGGLNTVLECTGKNPELLERVLHAKLADKLNFYIDAASFILDSPLFQEDFIKSVALADNYQRFGKVTFFIDVSCEKDKVSYSVFEKIAQVMEKSTRNNRLPILITNKNAIDANLYAYRQAMGEWQLNADLHKRLF